MSASRISILRRSRSHSLRISLISFENLNVRDADVEDVPVNHQSVPLHFALF